MANESPLGMKSIWPPALRLPVVLTFEHESGEGAPMRPGDRRNANQQGQMEYGARRGIWHLLEMLDRLGAKATFFVSGVKVVGLLAHARALKSAHSEGAASFYEQTTTYGYPYWLRNGLLGLSLLLIAVIVVTGNPLLFVPLTLSAMTAAIIGRALFYVLVIPTTMPGAFFWRNRGFEEHARQTGLAAMPQVGVLPDAH